MFKTCSLSTTDLCYDGPGSTVPTVFIHPDNLFMILLACRFGGFIGGGLQAAFGLFVGKAVLARTAWKEHCKLLGVSYTAASKSETLKHPGVKPQWCFVSCSSYFLSVRQCLDYSLLPVGNA